jgi:hypothetical protein
MATKAELIAQIQAMYEIVGTPFETASTDEHVPELVNSYSVIVYESGLSETNKLPVLRSKYIDFIVYNEFLPGESAYYVSDEPTNDVNKDITSTGTLGDIHRMYVSEDLRGKVQAAIAISAQDILNEPMPYELLTSDANSGQNTITVNSSNIFWIGKTILLYDTLSSEELTIIGISGNNLILSSNLVNSYTTARTATARYLNNAERQQWATNALINPDAFTLCMTSLVSLDPTIQAAGGLATDNSIRTVVNSFINKVAAACYL